MENNGIHKRSKISINSFAFLIFILIISVIVGGITLKIATGGAALANSNNISESTRIVISYTDMMVKQNDFSNNIIGAEKLGLNGFIIKNFSGEADLDCVVYFEDGTVYENIYYGEFDKNLSEKIIDIKFADFSVNNNALELDVSYGEKTLKKIIHFRTIGDKEE